MRNETTCRVCGGTPEGTIIGASFVQGRCSACGGTGVTSLEAKGEAVAWLYRDPAEIEFNRKGSITQDAELVRLMREVGGHEIVELVPAAQEAAKPVEQADASRDPFAAFADFVDAFSGDGQWRPCSGCHDTEDGHATAPNLHSEVLGCAVGNGCGECGGLGVVWNNFDQYDGENKPEQALGDGVDMQAIVHAVKEVGAEVDGGDSSDAQTGYAGYGACFTFDEKQIVAFVAKVRGRSDEDEVAAYIDPETKELHSASHIDWSRKKGVDVSWLEPLFRATTPRPAVATPAEVTDVIGEIIGDLCDMEPDDADHPDTICVKVEHLRIVLERRLAAQPSAVGVPEGFELKPREPTTEMFKACDTVIQGYGAKLVWQRMYDAAPSADTRDAGNGEVQL